MKNLQVYIFLIFSLLICNTATAGAYATDSLCSDMALIYQGGTQRPDWTESEIMPYVVHKFADGHTDWWFDSYLFYEFTNNWAAGFANAYGSRKATKADWEWLLDRIFAKNLSLDALDHCIEHQKAIIGDPKFRHKIVLGVCSPIVKQTDWGSLDGVALDFNVRADQVKATTWYIDQLMDRFSKANYKNIDLVGFYWIDETTAACGDLPKDIAPYIHNLGKRFYWIPYWNAPGFYDWKELGFDVAYQQPNHFFDKTILDNRLVDACRSAKLYGMGLEMEWDYRALYENTDSYYSRLESYINTFETRGVFDASTIAYYSGTKAILQMYESSSIENTMILDRIANHILDRRAKRAGVDVAERDSVTIYGGEGEILITGNSSIIKVYDINGRLISENQNLVICQAGLYIVNADGKAKKIIVR